MTAQSAFRKTNPTPGRIGATVAGVVMLLAIAPGCRTDRGRDVATGAAIGAAAGAALGAVAGDAGQGAAIGAAAGGLGGAVAGGEHKPHDAHDEHQRRGYEPRRDHGSHDEHRHRPR